MGTFVNIACSCLILFCWNVKAAPTSTSDTCRLYHNGCEYKIYVSGKDCMAKDSPGFTSYREAPIKRHVNEEMPVEKLDELEKKLTRKFTELSVRSLRHIRQIKTDLREVTSTMETLRHGRRKKRTTSCPRGFVGSGTWDSCYRFSTFNTTWYEAKEYCSAFGSKLLAVDNLQESYILNYLIKTNPEYQTPKGWWTGGHYNVRNRQWMWATKHHWKAISFSRWAPNEPDARSTMHCMVFYKHAQYRWHDATCTSKFNFICESEII